MILGFDIGGTKSAVISGEKTPDGIKITDKIVFPTVVNSGVPEFIDFLCDEAEKLCKNPESIGISCGGPLDSKNGVIISPPNLPGWENTPICKIISDRFGCKVNLQNDANACAYAEWKFGAGKGTKNMIFLTFGTGLGAGLIIDGKLYSGTNDMAGEVGHIRLEKDGPIGFGKKGSAEGFCSGSGIRQLAEKTGSNAFSPSAKDVAKAANKGNETAKAIYENSGRHLGMLLSVLIDVLNPEKIVIGSIFARSENLLRPSMEAVIEKEALKTAASVCEIVPAKLNENIGDYAALATAII